MHNQQNNGKEIPNFHYILPKRILALQKRRLIMDMQFILSFIIIFLLSFLFFFIFNLLPKITHVPHYNYTDFLMNISYKVPRWMWG